MENALKIVIEAVDKATEPIKQVKKTVDEITESYRSLGKYIDEISNRGVHSVSALEKAMKAARNAADKFSGSLGRLGQVARKVLGSFIRLKTLIVAAFSTWIVNRIVATADSYQRLVARLNMVTSSTQELIQVKERLFRVAQSARAPLETVYELYARLAVATRNLGLSSNELTTLVDTMIKGFKAFGLTTQEAASAALQLSQAFASGRLQGDEFRSVYENFPVLMQYVAKAMGVSTEQLKELGSQGKITAQVLLKAFQLARVEIERNFSQMPVTLSEAFTMVHNAMQKLLGETAAQTHAFDRLKAQVLGLAKVFQNIGAKDAANQIKALGDVAADVFSAMVHGVYYLAKAFLGLETIIKGIELLYHKLVVGFTELKGRLKAWVEDTKQSADELYSALGAPGVVDPLEGIKPKLNKEELQTIEEHSEKIASIYKGLDRIAGNIQDIAKLKDKWIAASKEIANRLAHLGKQGKRAGQQMAKGGKQAAQTYQLAKEKLEKYKHILDKITLASMPEHQRQIEAIRQKYEKLKEELKSIPEAAYKQLGLTRERVQELLKALDRQEQQEINKALQKHVKYQKTLVDRVKELWSGVYEDLTGILERWIEQGKIRLNDLLAYFKSFVARMVSYWLMGIAQMQFAGLVYVPGKGAVKAGAVSHTGMNFLSPLGMIRKGLGNYFSLLSGSANIFGKLFYETGWKPFLHAYDFFASPTGSVVGAGLLGAATSLLLTGDWKKSALSGLGTGLGFAFAGPIGGAIGGVLGSIAGGLFGKKKPKKPRLYVFQDTAEFTIEQFMQAYDEGVKSLNELLKTDVDHIKHSKKAEDDVARVVGDVMKALISPWETWIKAIDKMFNYDLVDKFYKFQLRFEQVKIKSKHLKEKFEKWVKEELPKLVETQLMDFVKAVFSPFIVDKEKFNKWLDEWKQKIETAKPEELENVLNAFQQEATTLLKATNVLRQYWQSLGSSTLDAMTKLVRQFKGYYDALSETGLLDEDRVSQLVDVASLSIKNLLDSALGFYDEAGVQIERFQQLYPKVWAIIDKMHLSWADLYEVMTHLGDYMPQLEKIAKDAGISVEELIAELGNLTVAMKNSAESMRSLAEKALSLGVASPAEYTAYMYSYWSERFKAVGVELSPETLKSRYSDPDYVSRLLHDNATKLTKEQLALGLDYLEWLKNTKKQTERACASATSTVTRSVTKTANVVKDKFADMVKSIREQILKLIHDISYSSSHIGEDFLLKQARYIQLLQKALRGSADDVKNFMSFVNKYLESIRKYAATPEEYERLRAKIVRDLYSVLKHLDELSRKNKHDQTPKESKELEKYYGEPYHGFGPIPHSSRPHSAAVNIVADIVKGVASGLIDAFKKSGLNLNWRHLPSVRRTTHRYTTSSAPDSIVSDIVNSLTNTLKKGGLGLDWRYLPHFATGGVITTSTLALVGEGARDEAVLPLPYGERTLDVLFEEVRQIKAENRMLLAENKRLREELYRLNYEILKESKKTNRLLGKWDSIGMPPEQQEGATV